MQARSLLAVKAALAPWCQVLNLLVDVENRQKGNCPVQRLVHSPWASVLSPGGHSLWEDCND